MKVKKQFYCIQERKTYNVGNEYKGKRNDIKEYLEQEIDEIEVVKPKVVKSKKKK